MTKHESVEVYVNGPLIVHMSERVPEHLLDAIDRHRRTIDEATRSGHWPKDRDDLDNEVYNAARKVGRGPLPADLETEQQSGGPQTQT